MKLFELDVLLRLELFFERKDAQLIAIRHNELN